MCFSKKRTNYLSNSEVAELPAYLQHLDISQRGEYLKLINKHFDISKSQFDKFGTFDQAVVAKTAHWIEFYPTKFTILSKEFQNLNSQYCVIATLTAIESAIGMPVRVNQVKRIKQFFNNNLDDFGKKQLAESIKFYDDQKGWDTPKDVNRACNELVNMRHGLLHRADLINLPTEGIGLVGSAGRDIRRMPYFISNKLNPKVFLCLTKKALSNYFLSQVKRPKQMLDKIYPKPI